MNKDYGLRHPYGPDEETFGAAHEHGLVGHGVSLNPGQVKAIAAKLGGPGAPLKKANSRGELYYSQGKGRGGRLNQKAKAVTPTKVTASPTSPVAPLTKSNPFTKPVRPGHDPFAKPASKQVKDHTPRATTVVKATTAKHAKKSSHSSTSHERGHGPSMGGVLNPLKEAAHLSHEAVAAGTMTKIPQQQMFSHEGKKEGH